MSYTFKINIADKNNYGSVRNTSKIKYIVMHYTGNDGDSDEANANYFKTPDRGASAHYFIDDDSVTQSVPDNYTAWHCGAKSYRHPECRNANSIGVEMCDTRINGTYDVSPETLENAVTLVKSLMAKYHIPVENVIRHYDVTGKLCPAYFVNDTGSWKAFRNRLSGSDDISGTTASGNTIIREGQLHANNFVNAGLAADGKRGPSTKAAGIKVLQHAMNLDYGKTIETDGKFGPKSRHKLGKHYVKYGERQYMVTAAEILLLLKGYDPNGVEAPGHFGNGMKRAVLQYQKDKQLSATGIVDSSMFQSLIS